MSDMAVNTTGIKNLDAIHSGELQVAEYDTMPVFNLQVPKQVSNVPTEVLMPQNTWIDKEAYSQTVNELAHLFKENFVTYEDCGGHVTKEEAHLILSAGPVAQNH